MQHSSKNILERLEGGEVVLGDGSYCATLEKRGYVKAGHYTPEASVENPEAVEALAYEYARAGADITQTFTYYSRDVGTPDDVNLTCGEINQGACNIAKKIAKEKGTIVAGGIVQTGVFSTKRDKKEVHEELREGLEVLIQNDIDLIIVEFFGNIIEMEWAIELALSYNKPVAATMCIGPKGDTDGVQPEECAVRMARAGAHIIGTNCKFDPFISLETMRRMKAGLDAENLHPYLMCQPLGFRTPDVNHFGGFHLPEFPFAMEPRQITRIEAAQFAREAYHLGIRVIGGCCGIESHHIRAMAEELAVERGGLPEGSRKSDHDLSTLKKKGDMGRDEFKMKGSKEYWQSLIPCTGRPLSSALNRTMNPEVVDRSVLN
ncbi:betaine--homocysteine S-methyltransferase 1 isoform X2 [Eurytemora carolleeae]|uniref:betaine--homocysteine S-methyltransferase 1 isoform X2 n=1 Tax=Eurytemora carolleeae TaxID=1294199 RepID=UPI000C77AEE7|nr:betaine--homocysteine S-methyltransferase 1 isoform X2 [Eurytemora carolleeae]|eukprot:XP_023327836.1 betaine--homocysteine S-methyltransferase 1-like isoform X2 [Eurytemora affinis]